MVAQERPGAGLESPPPRIRGRRGKRFILNQLSRTGTAHGGHQQAGPAVVVRGDC